MNRFITGLLSVAAMLGAVTTAQGSPITQTFLIDSSLSTYSISGSILDADMTAQAPGSLTTFLSGYLTVEYELGGTFTILESSIIPIQNGVFLPFNAPAANAFAASTNDGTIFGAVRNVSSYIGGSTTMDANGAFSASELTLSYDSFKIDVLSPQWGYVPFSLPSNVPFPLFPGLMGQLHTNTPNGPRLEFDVASGGPLTLGENPVGLMNFQGTIVAVAVPEASSLVMMATAGLSMAGYGLMRKRCIRARS